MTWKLNPAARPLRVLSGASAYLGEEEAATREMIALVQVLERVNLAEWLGKTYCILAFAKPKALHTTPLQGMGSSMLHWHGGCQRDHGHGDCSHAQALGM